MLWNYVRFVGLLLAFYFPIFLIQLIAGRASRGRRQVVRRMDDPKAFWRSLAIQVASIIMLATICFIWWGPAVVAKFLSFHRGHH
jgi:hypothetical protein